MTTKAAKQFAVAAMEARGDNRVVDKRLAQLHGEIYHLKNRITELDEELRIKQSIINKQVAMMGRDGT